MLQKAVIVVGASFSALVAVYFLRRISRSKTKTVSNSNSVTEVKTNNNVAEKKTNNAKSTLTDAETHCVDKFESQAQDSGVCTASKSETSSKSFADEDDKACDLAEETSPCTSDSVHVLDSSQHESSSSSKKVLLSDVQSVENMTSVSDDQKHKSLIVDFSDSSVSKGASLVKEEIPSTNNSVSLFDTSSQGSSTALTDDNLPALEQDELNGNKTSFRNTTTVLGLSRAEGQSGLLNKTSLNDSVATLSSDSPAKSTSVLNVSSASTNEELESLDNSPSLANVDGDSCSKSLLDSPTSSSVINHGSINCGIPSLPVEDEIRSCKSDSLLTCKIDSDIENFGAEVSASVHPEKNELNCSVSELASEETCDSKISSIKNSSLISDGSVIAKFGCEGSVSVGNSKDESGLLDSVSPCKNESTSLTEVDKALSDVTERDISDCEIHVASPIDDEESFEQNPLSACYESNKDACGELMDDISKKSIASNLTSCSEAPASLLNEKLESLESKSSLVCESKGECSTNDIVTLSGQSSSCANNSGCDIALATQDEIKSYLIVDDSEMESEIVKDDKATSSEIKPDDASISEIQTPSPVNEELITLKSELLKEDECSSGAMEDVSPSNSSISGCDDSSISSNSRQQFCKHDTLSVSKDEVETVNDSGRGTGDDAATDSSPLICDSIPASVDGESQFGAPDSMIDVGKEDDDQEDSVKISPVCLSTNNQSTCVTSLESDVQPGSQVCSPLAFENNSEKFSGEIKRDDVSRNSSEDVDATLSSSDYGSAWSNGTETTVSTDNCVKLTGNVQLEEKLKTVMPEIKHYYDNHQNPQLHTKQGAHPTDYKRLWPQPKDGLVFVPSSPGQPLVPGYLRNPEFLRTRHIPSHDPATVAYLAKTMASLNYVPESWVRVISVSDDLQLRVRTDQRDMLCELMERMGVCNPRSRPPRAEKLEVGSYVAARLEVPQKGVVWCRVHITRVIQPPEPAVTEKRSKNNKSKQNWRTPEPLFMVESIDHYPAASAQPLRAVDLRNLTEQAWNAPFYDQTISLLNTMPLDGLAYGSAAREFLLDVLRKGNNFVRVAELFSTVIDGVMNYFGSLESYADRMGPVYLDSELKNAGLATPIYTGSRSSRYFFQYCMFQGNQAFWYNDNRKPVLDISSRGPSHPLQEYAYLCYEHGPMVLGFRGFKLPYVHKFWNSMRLGLNVNMHELSVLMKHPLSFMGNPEQVLQQVLSAPESIFRMGLYAEALHAIYLADLSCKPGTPGMHYAFYFTQRQSVPLALPKDELNFLIPDSTFDFGEIYSVETLRKPLSA